MNKIKIYSEIRKSVNEHSIDKEKAKERMEYKIFMLIKLNLYQNHKLWKMKCLLSKGGSLTKEYFSVFSHFYRVILNNEGREEM